MENALRIERLAELLPGRTYVIEYPQYISEKVKDRLLESLYCKTQHLKCLFIILDGGGRFARESICDQ